MKYIYYSITTAALVLGLCYWSWSHNTQYRTVVMTMGGEPFTTEVADTPALQQLGLSYRKSIGPNNAMLFVFGMPGDYKFWMKDMNFPLDIIWLSSDKKIIYIKKDLSPQTYPQSFGPATSTQYVIEVAQGTVERLKLVPSQVVSW